MLLNGIMLILLATTAMCMSLLGGSWTQRVNFCWVGVFMWIKCRQYKTIITVNSTYLQSLIQTVLLEEVYIHHTTAAVILGNTGDAAITFLWPTPLLREFSKCAQNFISWG